MNKLNTANRSAVQLIETECGSTVSGAVNPARTRRYGIALTWLVAALIVSTVFLLLTASVNAQNTPATPQLDRPLTHPDAGEVGGEVLHQDLRDVFDRLIDDLSSEVGERFKKALEENTPQVEFTPAQFRRFKANPANPFEGLSHINPKDNSGNIILKFELPSLRNRRLDPLERQHISILRALRPVVVSAAGSTVAVKSDGRQIAVGIVVTRDGRVVTKASELKNKKNISVDFGDGRTMSARIVRQDRRNDVALLEVEARDLTPVIWSTSQVLPGAFVCSPTAHGKVYSLGTYSVIPISTLKGKTAFLGVRPNNRDGDGLLLSEITRDTAASRAGLQNGDIMTSFGGTPMNTVADLFRVVKLRSPGDVIEIEFIRGGTASRTEATLAGRDISGQRAKEFKMMNRLGAIPSRRAGNFPNVFQHDSPMFPELIGGPVVDLDGNVIGMNISRTGRTGCYAIPSSHMKQVIDELLREDGARRQ